MIDRRTFGFQREATKRLLDSEDGSAFGQT
jgi:hypothetical protein